MIILNVVHVIVRQYMILYGRGCTSETKNESVIREKEGVMLACRM